MFNVRVYGILTDENRRVLVSDECIRGNLFTKFPGGGLEFGEGTRACLEREFREETGLEVTVLDHLYTTDFFQLSAFHTQQQIIAIYYWVRAKDLSGIRVHSRPFAFTADQLNDPEGQFEALRWIAWDDLEESLLTLPIDRVVVRQLKQQHA
jgi:8-oxo-dGTP diphosphatase